MSGQQWGTVIGGLVGAYFGYPQLGAAIGGYVGGVIDPTVIKGPSIGDAQQQTSLGGQPIPKCYGHCPPIAPTLIDGDPVARKIKVKSGGKGDTTQTEQEKFIATRAFLVCEGPIQGYARITRNGKLVYSTQPGDQIEGDSAKFAAQITIYLGDESQGPDPSLEAIHGVGNTPYYRGRSYFVVRDDDETQTGGAANQYRVEVIAAGTTTTSCDNIYADALFYFPLDDAAQNGTAREVINNKTGTYSDTATLGVGPPLRAGSAGSFQMNDIGDYMRADWGGNGPPNDFSMVDRSEWTVSCYAAVTNVSPDTAYHGTVLRNMATCWQSAQFGYRDWSLTYTIDMHARGGWSDGATDPHDLIDPGGSSSGFFMLTKAADGTATLYRNGTVVKSQVFTNDDLPGRVGRYICVGGAFYPDSYGMIGLVSDVAGWSRCFSAAEVMAAYQSADDFVTLPDLIGARINGDGVIASICTDEISADTVMWKDIVADIAGRASPLLPAHLDIDNMTDIVPGFVLGNTTLTGTDYLRTLCTFYTVDLPEYDDKLHAIRRGGAVVATLDPDDMLAVEDEDNDERSPALQAYQRLTVMYPDPANQYVPTPQTAPRTTPDVTTTNQVTLQCPIPFDADTMAQKTDILQKIAFLQVEGTFKRAFGPEYSKYVSSDPIIFNNRRHIITKVSTDDCMVRFEGTYDRPSAYTSQVTGTVAPPPKPPTTGLKGPSILAAMNLPSLRSADNVPGIYLAVGAMLNGWPGADIYVSYDGGATESLEMTITDEATMGSLVSDCDSGATDLITVKTIHKRQISSVTDAQIAARANAFAIITGGVAEIGQVKTATETATAGTYDLTDLTRGELGTTAAAHNADDRFVMLDTAVKFLPIDASYAGQTLILRAVTRGTVPSANPTVSLVFDPPTFIIDGGGA